MRGLYFCFFILFFIFLVSNVQIYFAQREVEERKIKKRIERNAQIRTNPPNQTATESIENTTKTDSAVLDKITSNRARDSKQKRRKNAPANTNRVLGVKNGPKNGPH